MPHDQHGTPLKPGDEVIIRYIVKDIQPGVDYCNCHLESVHGRLPDGLTEGFSGNISVCERVMLPTHAGTARKEEMASRPRADFGFGLPYSG